MYQVRKSLLVEVIDSITNHDGIFSHKTEDQVRVWFDPDEGQDDGRQITIIFNAPDSLKNRQGIHLNFIENREDLSFRLSDAFESCFRNGFEHVYIHKASFSVDLKPLVESAFDRYEKIKGETNE